jgi:hypothetical protein
LRAKKRHHILGTHEKRAFNSMRCRVRQDMAIFGQTCMALSRQELVETLSKEQMENYPKYCLVPRNPNQSFSIENSAVVTALQRSYIVGRWKVSRDVDEYQCNVKLMLGNQDESSVF